MLSTDKQKAEQTAKLILSNLKKSFGQKLELKGLDVTASMGIAFAPDDGEDIETLYKKADLHDYCHEDDPVLPCF